MLVNSSDCYRIITKLVSFDSISFHLFLVLSDAKNYPTSFFDREKMVKFCSIQARGPHE